jgi:hypothetical protein
MRARIGSSPRGSQAARHWPVPCRSVLTVVAVSMALAPPAGADVIFPTTTRIDFERNGQPHREPVTFTVTCVGYDWPPGRTVERAPGTYTPEVVFSFSATCARYGCTIEEPYYLNYRHVDSCDLSGSTGGRTFRIENYASLPIDFSTCADAGGVRRCALRVDLDLRTVTSIPPDAAPRGNPGHPAGRSFLLALLLTLVVELTELWLLLRFVFRKPEVDTGRLLFVGTLASALTLPYLWFVFPALLEGGGLVYGGELLVAAIEAVVLYRLLPVGFGKAIVLSALANAASFAAGLAIF